MTPQGQAPSTLQNNQAGLEMKAIAFVQLATRILEQALPVFGADSDNGKTILRALQVLSNRFGRGAEASQDAVAKMYMQMQALQQLQRQRQMQAQLQGQAPANGGIG